MERDHADDQPAGTETQPSLVRQADDGRRDGSQLSDALSSPDVERRREALEEALLAEPDEETVEAAAQALHDPEEEVRSLALQVLEAAPHLAPSGPVAGMAQDWNPKIRARAMALLGRTGDVAVVTTLKEQMAAETEPAVVEAGLRGLLQLLTDTSEVEPETLDRVTAAVGGLAPPFLSRFAHLVRRLAGSMQEEEIVSRLDDQDDVVRLGAAAVALARDTGACDRALADLESDGNPAIRRLAKEAASRLPQRATDASEK